MATVTIDVNAIDQLTGDAAEAGIREALGEAERLLKSDILNRPGTGRKYGKHTASAPGQPPAPDLGFLRANTNADPNIKERVRYDTPGSAQVVGRVVANAAYAEWLAKGTERMAARPYYDELVSKHRQALADAFARGARR